MAESRAPSVVRPKLTASNSGPILYIGPTPNVRLDHELHAFFDELKNGDSGHDGDDPFADLASSAGFERCELTKS
jgi:hypothetical protein